MGALEIGPTVTLESSHGSRIEAAVAAFEERVGPLLPSPHRARALVVKWVGPLLPSPDRARALVVKWDKHPFTLRIWRMRSGELVVQFGDARASNGHAAAFRRHLEQRYQVQVRSLRTSGRRW